MQRCHKTLTICSRNININRQIKLKKIIKTHKGKNLSSYHRMNGRKLKLKNPYVLNVPNKEKK